MAKIFENFWIKIIALILGILLWFHVATEKTYTYQLYLPVSEIILDHNLTLNSSLPESLMVTISASGKQIMRKKWRSRGVKIIASQFEIGKHDINLSTSNVFLATPTPDVALEDIVSPSSIKLVIDNIAETSVEVKPDIIAEADEGYAVSLISSTTPSHVTLKGPEALVNKIPVIFTEQKKLQGLRSNIELTLALAAPFGYGIELSPDSVSLYIEVIPVKTRLFNQIPIAVYNPPIDSIVDLVPQYVQVELTGPPAEIDLLNKNKLTASVDYSQKSESGKAVLTIDCPVKFKIRNATPDSVLLLTR